MEEGAATPGEDAQSALAKRRFNGLSIPQLVEKYSLGQVVVPLERIQDSRMFIFPNTLKSL
jgi:hypothetical protein